MAINTTLVEVPLGANAACTDDKKPYQSWRLDNWLRQYQMAPASETPGSTSAPANDTGPSFALTSLTNNEVFNCTTSGRQNNVFGGACTSTVSGSSGDQASFEFDPDLNILTIRENSTCATGSSVDAVGIAYMQAACARDYHSDVFTCTSDPVWIGTGIF